MKKVLYVEDHEAQRDILIQMLELQGYEVDVACTGEEGVEKVREWHPDVVLMDILMPEGRIDGFEAIRQLRASPGTADIPIIVISAWGSAKHRGQAKEAGVKLLVKPVDMEDLIEAIKRHLPESKSSTHDQV